MFCGLQFAYKVRVPSEGRVIGMDERGLMTYSRHYIFPIAHCFIQASNTRKMASLSEPPSTSHWLYFLAGALLPTIAYSLSKSGKKSTSSRDADDDDLNGVETTGPSSQWGFMQGPYKVSKLLISFLTNIFCIVLQNGDLTFYWSFCCSIERISVNCHPTSHTVRCYWL
jgi:hypothetical protein